MFRIGVGMIFKVKVQLPLSILADASKTVNSPSPIGINFQKCPTSISPCNRQRLCLREGVSEALKERGTCKYSFTSHTSCQYSGANIIGLPGHKNKRKSVYEMTKMYYFYIQIIKL